MIDAELEYDFPRSYIGHLLYVNENLRSKYTPTRHSAPEHFNR